MLLEDIQKCYKYYKDCNQVVETDTRKISKGCLFFCLKGENFDGNKFALQALELGAKYVISDDQKNASYDNVIVVQDSLKTLQKLANYHRKNLTVPVFAIGGSNGKTTTKEFCNAVASTTFNTYSTPGNFNNHIGLPLTLLAVKPEVEFVIVEMGTNHIGEMNELIEIGKPDFGTVTNIGKEHLEGFGTIEAIVKEESELINYLIPKNGKILLNCEDKWLNSMGKRINANQKLTFGFDINNNLYAKVLETMPHATYELSVNGEKAKEVKLKIGGAYNILNSLCAVAMGVELNIPIDTCIDAIENYEPSNNRSQWIKQGKFSILLDAYNANPSSVELALAEFNKIKEPKMILLGDMFELGNHALDEHLNIIKLGNQLQNTQVFYCGSNFKQAAPNSPMVFETKQELELKLKNTEIPAYVLIKGSRGMKMEDFLSVIV